MGILVAQHEFQKAAGEVQDAAWLAAAHHLDTAPGCTPSACRRCTSTGWAGRICSVALAP